MEPEPELILEDASSIREAIKRLVSYASRRSPLTFLVWRCILLRLRAGIVILNL